MGGWGSGRPEKSDRAKTTAGQCSINILTWHRDQKLVAGSSFDWGHAWWQKSFPDALKAGPALRVHVLEAEYPENGYLKDRPDCLEIEHLKIRRKEPERIALEWTPCHFGGARPWLVCPGCDERAGKLYHALPEKRPGLRCRRCLGLAYESQRQDFRRRLAETAKRGRRKVAGWPALGLLTPFPPRPKGMHHATYERLRTASVEAERAWLLYEIMDTEKMSQSLHRKFPSLRAASKESTA